jgi:uncharacterized membrane protein
MVSSAAAPSNFEKQLGTLLRVGVAIAASVVLIGGVIYLAKYYAIVPDYKNFHGEPDEYRNVSKIFEGLRQLQGRAFIQLGLLLLIATPVVRVAVSVFDFLSERDWLYVSVTLFVLAVLVYSLAIP